MDLSLTRRRGGPDTDLSRQTVGNALVVHPATGMTDEAQALALGVAADAEHDLVVVDLPVDSPISLWESVAKALPRRRRGVRLVIGGRSRETSALAGQWLAERIGRPVLAPDGSVIPSAGGALFVHSGRGSGWVRFQPGRPPRWEAKRFPRPSWDSGVTSELTSTSSRGVAEPLPGGLWIRPVGVDRRLGHHRSALIRGLPALLDTMTIVLGCPGCPPLTMDDAARLWMRLPEPVRHQARFVQYGPMSVPAGTTLGQALADLLGREVGFCTGIPIGAPHEFDVWTVRYDGSLVWAPFARELAYVPGQPLPRVLDHRPPISGLKEIEPAVYWYSPDAVLEVVQSGLLLRPPAAGPTAEALRGVTLDTTAHNLTYDVSSDAAERMRFLAEDVLARLDDHTRGLSRILPAAALLAERARAATPRRAPAQIEGPPLQTISERLDPGAVVASSLDAVTITTAAPARVAAELGVAMVSDGPVTTPPARVDTGASVTPRPEAPAIPLPPPAVPPAGLRAAGSAVSDGAVQPAEVAGGTATDLPSGATAETTPRPSAAPPTSGGAVPAPPPPAVPPAGVVGGSAGTNPAPIVPSGASAASAPLPAVPLAAVVGGSVGADPGPIVPGGAATTPPPAVPPAGVLAGSAGADPGPIVPSGASAASAPPPAVPPAGVVGGPAAGPGAEAPTSHDANTPEPPPSAASPLEVAGGGTSGARLQPTPAAEAAALVPKRGVDKEREWLRKSLGAEYGLMSNTAARILSEHPGFQGALAASPADVLTDAVAVQLYLSAKGAAVDAGLRAGRSGPHVPIARCVVAGLRRLPSHRGPASFTTSPTAAQWALYRTRKVLTEWGFLHTTTTPMSTSDGDTDFLVWSVTARRTKLLEPDGSVADRALFVPGTSFKVLEITEPGGADRGLVLLRELTVSEVDETGRVAADRISLDELALESLRRELEMWAETDGRTPIATAAAARFGVVPGLV
ncbi:hypothetical protein M8542_34125 [Amycolatopsis sp. OK19-0408]|uniref:Uncharacterized protein n=1 Tax=Amycolatopsis iheyensis TaxID=2945988 RepID=A0A9X2NFI8_9PSEU|nr:hypothetical protein [Amycolatopsis iheyensis]MCR6487876.1 hypothetical protein [Amycolatopsis iheyensis]